MRRYLFPASIAAVAIVGSASAARTSHSVASFYTPEKAAFCKYVIPMGFPGPTGLECWTPNDGFTVWMRPNGIARKAYVKENRLRYATAYRRLTFAQNWWGSDLNSGGASYDLEDRYREGTGSPRGTVQFVCKSRRTGLTCTNRAGRGWWLGRFKGYRIF